MEYRPDLPFSHFPTLESERVILRQPRDADAPRILDMYGHIEVKRAFFMTPIGSMEQAQEILDNWKRAYRNQEGLRWVIQFKDDSRAIGIIAFRKFYRENRRAEIGYIISEEVRRQGILNETMHLALNYLYGQMGLKSVEAFTFADNIPSQNALKKIGFLQEGYMKHYQYFEGEYRDMMLFSLQREEFRQ